jgi:hypothetical protein
MLSKYLALPLILSALSWIVFTLWASLTFGHMSTICSHFSSRLIMSNFSPVPIVFYWFFTWIVLGNVDLHFSLMLVRKDNAVEKETKWAAWLYHQCNQSIHVTDGMTVMSLFPSLLQKISVATNRLCQIVLKRNHTKRTRIKWDLPVYPLCSVMLKIPNVRHRLWRLFGLLVQLPF